MKVLKHNQLDNNSSTGFLISQVMFFFGSLPLIVAAIIAFFSYKSFKPYRFIGISFLAVADKSLAAFKMIPVDELENTLVICNNYGQAGALNYYNRTKMPEAYAFNTDYIYWLPHLKKIKNILLVGRKPGDDVIGAFTECKLIGVVENEQAREKNTGIYLLTGAKDLFTPVFYNKVEERKKKLDIF